MSRNKRLPSSSSAYRLADALGVFSLALGVAETLLPRRLGAGIGSGREGLITAYGLREIVTGIGILGSRDPRPWIWARVAGDVMDIATIVAAGDLSRRGSKAALASVTIATVLDIACARRLDGGQDDGKRIYDYSMRSGFPRPPAAMRGIARDRAPATRPTIVEAQPLEPRPTDL